MVRSHLLSRSLSFLLILYMLSSCASTETQTTSQTMQGNITTTVVDESPQLHILFLGDDGHHQPEQRIQSVIPYFAERGIQIHYTDRQEDLNLENLMKHDVFMMYGNRTGLPRQQETALLTYVQDGGGFVAIHSASASFNDSDAFVNLVGGAFKSHGVGTFKTRHLQTDHPVMQKVPNFESWDETYVHTKHNPDKTILSERVDGNHREPWTWVRSHGDGRVFYTAWGHDDRTWSHEGFHKLLDRGIRWSAGDWALDAEFSLPEITFGEGKLPYYPPGEPWGTTGDPITQIQEPLSPEASREHIVSNPDFKVELFATEPDIVNPIDMTWDEKGRLWIVETVDYPNKFTDNREGNDRIKILEDTNGDGKADTFTIFADGLNIPTSLVLHDGGVIVSQAPDFYFLKDTTGDGRADLKEVLFSGWGTFDTHAGPNNLHYGFDNNIWGVVGYSAFEGTVGGEEHKFSSGIYKFQPEGTRLEYISNTTNNTWGLGFNEEGSVFASTANRNPAVHSAVPNRYYRSIRGLVSGQTGTPRLQMISNTSSYYPLLKEVRQVDHHGHYTSAAGFHIYTARNFPESYWNKRAFVSDPTGHLLGEFVLEPKGSDYYAHNAWNMLASRDEWFSPIQTKTGPDGALWMIDWYNLVIQHNPFPEGWERGEGNAYMTDLRDRQHARIYRVLYKEGEDKYQKFTLANASPTELVEALTHENMFWRLTAQRLLVERGELDVLPELYELVRDQRIDKLGLNPGALHALWTLEGLGALDGTHQEALQTTYRAMHHPASSVRRAALMVLPRNQRSLNKILSAGMVPVPHVPGEMTYTIPASMMMASDPKVRLAALLAIAEMPSDDRAGRAIAELIVHPLNVNDQWIRDASTAAAAQNEESFLPHIFTKQLPQDADSTFKANVSTVMQRVSRHYALGSNSASSIADFLFILEESDPVIGLGFLTGIAEGWPEDEVPSFSDDEKKLLNRFGQYAPEAYQENLHALADKWDLPELFGKRE